MPTRTPLSILLAVLLAAPVTPAPQATRTTETAAQTPVFPARAAAVLLDVVVRDKKGRSVPDIRAEEIEVYEDGVKQKVDSFKRVESEPPKVEGVAAPAPQPDASRHLNLVSLVFDQLGVDARRLAQKAGLSFIEKALQPNTWVAVFRIDQRLAILQTFTSDPARLKDAVLAATSGTQQRLMDEQAAMQQALQEAESLAAAAPDQATGAGPPASGGGFAARAQAQAVANMLRLSSTLQRQQSGSTSLYPLLALMRGHETLAGRKTLVYISEGLQVPPNLEAVFRSTISAANRANVSVYSIDARGLDPNRQFGATNDMLDQARRVSQRATQSPGGSVSKDEIFAADTAQSAIRMNVEGTLSDLSESTGGFVIANTNDFRKGAEQIATDLGGYYELTYTPPPAPFDGRFRSIQVKVARKDVVVQTRNGYFALPPSQTTAMFAYEVPLLGALSAASAPRDFEMRAAALRFDETKLGRDHKLIVEVPISSLKMVTDEAKKTYRVHFSLLATVKDKDGTIVERFSEDYPFEGPLEKAEALKLGNIVFKRRFSVPEGRYTLEVAGQDREIGKTSVTKVPLEVPGSSPGPKMSSVALIRRVEPTPQSAPGAAQEEDPLDVAGMRIVPNLDAPISAATNQKLSVFMIAYPASGGEKPRMTLEFVRDGKTVGKSEPDLPAPDGDGKIRYVGTFPIASFKPGTYELKVALSGAGGGCQDRANFTIAP
jgi:VWFA-related protein